MSKRLTIATLAGLLMGVICWLGAAWTFGVDFSPPQVVNILLQRTVMGFVIGISALRMNWQAHGLLLGLVVGSIFALSAFLLRDQTGLGMVVILGLVPLGAVYGWAIEAITTKLLHAPAER